MVGTGPGEGREGEGDLGPWTFVVLFTMMNPYAALRCYYATGIVISFCLGKPSPFSEYVRPILRQAQHSSNSTECNYPVPAVNSTVPTYPISYHSTNKYGND